MKTEIGILIIITIIFWVYHRIKYKNTHYEKFEHYLDGEVNYFVQSWLEIFQVVVIIFGAMAFFVGLWSVLEKIYKWIIAI
jgi:succinate dehydrogenase hydrophobic anchor subunit